MGTRGTEVYRCGARLGPLQGLKKPFHEAGATARGDNEEPAEATAGRP